MFPTGGALAEEDVILSMIADSELQCSNECLGEPGCISINYKTQISQQKNCQLSNKTYDEIITGDGEWTFYQDLQTVSCLSFRFHQ